MRIVLLCLLTVSPAAWPATVAADPIQIPLRSDLRGAGAGAQVIDDQGEQHITLHRNDGADVFASAALSVQGNLARADSTLSSAAGERSLSGSGTATATATAPKAAAGAVSQFSIIFDLTTTQFATFDADFTVGADDRLASAVWSVFYIRRSAERAILQTSPRHDSFSFHRKDLLQPGSYIFDVRVESSSGGFRGTSSTRSAQSAFSFTYDLSDVVPTPEPASIVLLGSGLLGLFGFRHRRN
jgi:hypothetical protein